MPNAQRYPHLDPAMLAIFDDYDRKLATGEIHIEREHAANTDNPGQVWVAFTDSKVDYPDA